MFLPLRHMCNRGVWTWPLPSDWEILSGTVAAGALFTQRPVFFGADRLLSALSRPAVAQNHAGLLLRPKRRREGGGLTQLQALSTALASTIGTGSIAGVATAIFYGGPGAVFWDVVSAFLGMDDRMCRKDPGGALPGEKPRRRLAGRPHVLHGAGSGQPDAGRPVFPVLCGRSLGGGNVVQATPSPPPWRRPSAGTGWRWDWWWPC
mgnify:CR=1 FL=1